MMILCSNPGARYRALKSEIDAAVARVLERGHYVLGPEVRAFEEEFSRWSGASFGVGVGNATDAIEIALRAHGIGDGDEVITASHTATPTIAAIVAAGAVPIMIDIDPETFTLDPAKLEAALTDRTRAIMPVHLYGHPAGMGAVRSIALKRQCVVIEDASQAHGAEYEGARVGSLGAAAVFSFYPTKNLGGFGDGGMIVTSDAALADRCRMIREYGWTSERVSALPGRNSRLDELQAAILRAELAHLDDMNARRNEIAAMYSKALRSLPITLPTVRDGCRHAWHLYVIRTERRDALMKRLREDGIAAGIHYPSPNHHHPAFRAYKKVDLPETDRAAAEILSLPIDGFMPESEVLMVIDAVKRFFVGGRR